jgi:hypothetical protein
MWINTWALNELSEKEGWTFNQPKCSDIHGCPKCKCSCKVGTLKARLDWQDHTWTNNITNFYGGGSSPGETVVEFEFGWKPQWDFETKAYTDWYCPRAELYDAIFIAKGLHDAFWYGKAVTDEQLDTLSTNLDCFKTTPTKIIIRTPTKVTKHSKKMAKPDKVNSLLATTSEKLISFQKQGGFGPNSYILDANAFTNSDDFKHNTYDGVHYRRDTGLHEWEFQAILEIMGKQ